MIRVRGFGEKGLEGFYAAGHSFSAPGGRDIVCAAVSTLTQSAYLALVRYDIRCLCSQDEENAVLCVLLRESDENKLAIAHVIFTMMYAGLNAVEQQFPQYLRVTPRTEVET